MIQRVRISGVQLPRLYLAETQEDVRICKDNGLPYVRWKEGMDLFVRSLLRPAIEKMFPGINWNKVLGVPQAIRSNVCLVSGNDYNSTELAANYDADEMLAAQEKYDAEDDEHVVADPKPNSGKEFVRDVDIANGPRKCAGGDSIKYDRFHKETLSVYDYIGDVSSSVDFEVLKQLKLLPEFVGDVADIIRRNLSANQYWTEGYNKKLGYPLGNFKNKKVLPNLLIIDISWSIPDGIASTMLMLADTLRSELNADLIITSERSGYYQAGCELPSVQTLRNYYGRSNESREFMGILKKYIAGREWGHVVSFGDDDYPGMVEDYDLDMTGTVVHQVHHFHTRSKDTRTGYARWCSEAASNVDEVYNTSWANVMKHGYRL